MNYGYARISRKSQSIERQVRNIKAEYPDACIVEEAFTGTKLQGRKGLDKILKAVKTGDTIIFDSASRMSRNAAEAVELYEDLFNRGVDLVFLKEPQINTSVYREALQRKISVSVDTGSTATDTCITAIIDALNRFSVDLAKDQIRICFEQAQKEVDDLHVRTSEGIREKKERNKRILAGLEEGELTQIGQREGAKLVTRKSIEAKEKIKKYSRDFDGSLNDPEVIKLTGISRNSYYTYKRQLREEIAL